MNDRNHYRNLVAKARLQLGDGDFAGVLQTCDKISDIRVRSATLWVMRLLAQYRVRSLAELAQLAEDFGTNPSFRHAMRFANEHNRELLTKCCQQAQHRADTQSAIERVLAVVGVNKLGDTMLFGSYPVRKNGVRVSIVWRVVATQADALVLLCDQIIDIIPFSNRPTRVDWGSCTLRQWLNSVFVAQAFMPTERARLQKIDIDDQTSDLVTVPSEWDLKRLAGTIGSALLESTDFAQSKLPDQTPLAGCWLRDTADSGPRASIWASGHQVLSAQVDKLAVGVRPMIHLAVK